MIKVNINGQPLSSNYDTVVKDDNREFLAKLLLNGTEINCDIKRLEITKGSCGDTSHFSIGNIIGDSLIAEVYNLTDDIKGQKIEVQIGLETSPNTWEYICIGRFIISEVKKTIYSTTFTGYSSLVAYSGNDFSGSTLSSRSISRIGARLASDLDYSSAWFSRNINTSLEIDEAESLEGLKVYDGLNILTNLIGGYVINEPRRDTLDFYAYNNTITHTVESGLMTSLPDIEEKDFEITGISCIVTEGSDDIPATGFTRGEPVNLVFNSSYMTQDIFDNLADNLIGYKYRPGSINLSMGDPRIEGSDVLEVINPDNTSVIMPCHQVRHIYDGGFRTEVVSSSATDIENNIGTIYPIKKEIQDLTEDIVSIENDIKTINEDAQYFWHDNNGAHVTNIPKALYPSGRTFETLIRTDEISMRRKDTFLTTYLTLTRDGLLLNQSNSYFGNQEIRLASYMKMSSDAGLVFNDEPLYIDYLTTEPYNFNVFSVASCSGIFITKSQLRFTIPLPVFIAANTQLEVTSCNISVFNSTGTSCLETNSATPMDYTGDFNVTLEPNGCASANVIILKNSNFIWQNIGGSASSVVNQYESANIRVNNIEFNNVVT